MNNSDDNKFIKTRFGNHNFSWYSFSTALLYFQKAVFREVTHGLFTFNAATFSSVYFLINFSSPLTIWSKGPIELHLKRINFPNYFRFNEVTHYYNGIKFK